MGAHPISSSLVSVIAIALCLGCASEDLSVLNPAIAVCRGADGAACGDNFELGALAVGRTHEQTLYIRNIGAGYLDIRGVSLMDTSGEVLDYPVSLVTLVIATLAAPFLFGPRFFGAMFNALFAKRESMRVRVAGLYHFAVACYWAKQLRHQNVSLIHSQWIHSGGTITMYAAWLLNKPFSFTGHAAGDPFQAGFTGDVQTLPRSAFVAETFPLPLWSNCSNLLRISFSSALKYFCHPFLNSS